MPQWQITDTPRPAGTNLLIGPGEVIDGITDKRGNVVELRWRGQLLPSQALPINVVACDPEALAYLQLWHSGEAHRHKPITPLPPPAPLTPVPTVAAVPTPAPPTPPAWQLLTDWSAGSGPSQHIAAGEILRGITDRYGALTAIRWRDQTFGTALPMEAMALDQAAADELSRQHPERLFLLRAVSPATIRQLVNV
jgi:hypothetical protein